MSNNLLDFKIPENYGKGILIIASDTFKSFLREKRFYISFAYYFVLPIFLLFLQYCLFLYFLIVAGRILHYCKIKPYLSLGKSFCLFWRVKLNILFSSRFLSYKLFF